VTFRGVRSRWESLAGHLGGPHARSQLIGSLLAPCYHALPVLLLRGLSVSRTRRPVKDKGALMQTLHLWLQALRAISLRQSLSRWPTLSMPAASIWKAASPLPNHPRPTRTVGAASDAPRAGMKGPPGLSNSPGPTSAVGSLPVNSHQRLDRCPMVGAGLPLVSPFREHRVAEPDGASTSRVCRWQTACDLARYPAPHEAGDIGPGHMQARASVTLWDVAGGLSFSTRPQRCGARAGWKMIAGQGASPRAQRRRFRPAGG